MDIPSFQVCDNPGLVFWEATWNAPIIMSLTKSYNETKIVGCDVKGAVFEI
jgi:hypothetical protein